MQRRCNNVRGEESKEGKMSCRWCGFKRATGNIQTSGETDFVLHRTGSIMWHQIIFKKVHTSGFKHSPFIVFDQERLYNNWDKSISNYWRHKWAQNFNLWMFTRHEKRAYKAHKCWSIRTSTFMGKLDEDTKLLKISNSGCRMNKNVIWWLWILYRALT